MGVCWAYRTGKKYAVIVCSGSFSFTWGTVSCFMEHGNESSALIYQQLTFKKIHPTSKVGLFALVDLSDWWRNMKLQIRTSTAKTGALIHGISPGLWAAAIQMLCCWHR